MQRRRVTTYLGLMCLLTGAPSAHAEDVFAITDVRVFDGEEVKPRASVVVRDGVIAAIGVGLEIPKDARIVDGRGKTLLPGLIDSHTHSLSRDSLETALAAGVTTHLDMLTSEVFAREMRREQAAGLADDRADLFSAGTSATAPGGHGTEYGKSIPTLVGAGDAEDFVAARITHGADYIKIMIEDGRAFGHIWPTLDAATVEALTRAAHARGKKAVVHVSTLDGARQAVEAGADGLVHVWLDAPPTREFVERVRERGVFVVPTLAQSLSSTGTTAAHRLADASPLEELLTAGESEQLHTPIGNSRVSDASAKRSVRMLAQAGVPILAGTDAPYPGTAFGVGMHLELELLVDAGGLSPLQALRAATSAAAHAFGLEDRGRIAVGRRADLLLVKGDPTRDIRSTRAIVSVWKNGRRFDSRSFRRKLLLSPRSHAVEQARPIVPALVSDFEDGGPSSRFGSGWQATMDAIVGGRSSATLEIIEGGPEQSRHALEVRGDISDSSTPKWAGAIFFPGLVPMTPIDLSAAKGISFWARGDGATYRVLLFSARAGTVPVERSFASHPTWTLHRFAWSDFREDPGDRIRAIAIVAGPVPGAYRIAIDRVEIR